VVVWVARSHYEIPGGSHLLAVVTTASTGVTDWLVEAMERMVRATEIEN
jgi:hypothetical protein